MYDSAKSCWNVASDSFSCPKGAASFAFTIGDKTFLGIYHYENRVLVGEFWGYGNFQSHTQQTINNKELSLYPNPNNGNFVLNTSYPIQSYEICDMNGKEIYKNEVSQAGNDINIDLNLPKGMYLVRVVTSEGTVVKKFLVGD